MKILGFQKTTLLDYPGHIASMIFTAGCNLRCPYCQNSELIGGASGAATGPDAAFSGLSVTSEEEVLSHLKARSGRIEGLVITGGEPTLQPDLADFCRHVKELSMLVKLDTNGTNPDVLRTLLDAGLLDYVAMDAKLPAAAYDLLLPKNTSDKAKEDIITSVRESMEILRNSDVDYEMRTTVTDEFFDEDMVTLLGREFAGVKRLYLQPYRDSENVLMPGLHTPSDEKLLEYRDILSQTIPVVEIRGADL